MLLTTKAQALAKLDDGDSAQLARHLRAVEKRLATFNGTPIEYSVEDVPEITVRALTRELHIAGWTVDSCEIGRRIAEHTTVRGAGLRIS